MIFCRDSYYCGNSSHWFETSTKFVGLEVRREKRAPFMAHYSGVKKRNIHPYFQSVQLGPPKIVIPKYTFGQKQKLEIN